MVETQSVLAGSLRRFCCFSVPQSAEPDRVFPASVTRPAVPDLVFAQAADEHLQRPDVRLRQGRMPEPELRQRVAQGPWTPQLCAGLGPLPDALALEWFAASPAHVHETYQRLSVRHWQVHQPLPTLHQRLAASCRTPDALLQRITLPPLGSAARQPYAVRMLAAMVVHLQILRHRPTPQARPPTQGDVVALSTTACYACREPFVAGTPPPRLAGCAHLATLDRNCWLAALACGPPLVCPHPHCQVPIPPEWAASLGLAPAAVERLATRWSSDFLATWSNWQACATPGCVGGATVPPGRLARLSCGPCGEVRIVGAAGSQAAVALISQMLETYLGNPLRPMLPCLACGLPSQKVDGCSLVSCASATCQTAWRFVPNYVPQAGVLVDLGLFAPLLPGSTELPRARLQEVLRRNLNDLLGPHEAPLSTLGTPP